MDVLGSYLVDVLGDLVDVLGKVSRNKPDYWAIWWMFWEKVPRNKHDYWVIWWMFWGNCLVKDPFIMVFRFRGIKMLAIKADLPVPVSFKLIIPVDIKAHA